ncbi:bidirectional sugar transporter sweet1 [Phtheirospermum japonicum]|uniref:Bidirectional sugar transporter sweet1 n=1 Tax=Phtheirospermum japonicum TaxID=374723 RepID=A0A830D1U7_9LAMI|nr:bidirectional sugar transporter sweet1 [Phtheirospermum japonicum]
MTLLNCLLSAWYGLPFISKDNYLVTMINGTGAVIESVYMLIFLIFAAKREKAKIIGLLLSILAIFTTIALLSVLAFHDKAQKQQLCGYAATVFSIIMYASPLSIMRTVIKSKSVEYMPFLLSVFVFLCGTSWFVYGLIGKDKFLYIPNGFGSLLGTMQLILYAVYRNNKGAVDTTKSTTIETLEMGLPKPHQQKQPN